MSDKTNTPKNIYEQRFQLLMKLIRVDFMIKSAKIIYPKK